MNKTVTNTNTTKKNKIIIGSNYNYNKITIEINNDLFLCDISTNESTVSCGIYELDGISELEHIKNDSLRKEVLIKLLKFVKSNCMSAFIFMSNNMNTPNINKTLDELVVLKSNKRKNQNSGNMIKCWIY